MRCTAWTLVIICMFLTLVALVALGLLVAAR